MSNLLSSNSNSAYWKLLNSSNARIIFLCGPRAENIFRSPSKKRYSLELQEICYPIWVADSPPSSGFSKRLFIRCPARIWSNIRCDGAMFSEALRFAISMLELKENRPYSV